MLLDKKIATRQSYGEALAELGVDNSVDLILMIVDPSFESLKLTKKIQHNNNKHIEI